MIIILVLFLVSRAVCLDPQHTALREGEDSRGRKRGGEEGKVKKGNKNRSQVRNKYGSEN
jgi:hypothetical protein